MKEKDAKGAGNSTGKSGSSFFADGCRRLGTCYAFGLGVEQDFSKGLMLWHCAQEEERKAKKREEENKKKR